MSSSYDRVFAKLYNTHWTDYAHSLAPLLLSYYQSIPISETNKRVLDLCCGTGQLALHFLRNHFSVVGVDLSIHMLKYAVENCQAYLDSGQAYFVQGDITKLPLSGNFGFALSTYYSLNHLMDIAALRSSFAAIYDNLVSGGVFIFDMTTRLGELRWNSVLVEDRQEMMLVRRGFFDEENSKSMIKLSGFVQLEQSELYERFDIVTSNKVYEPGMVKQLLLDTGWREVYLAQKDALQTPIENENRLDTVFFIARKI